ncbi:MAG: alanine racemase [Chloroflexi bacterium]|nr:alanine racemase [Chloroflexota bacterium]
MRKPERLTTFAEIDLGAIAHNMRLLGECIGPDVELFAVVKANGYGHGAVEVARTALQYGASRLAVARVAEGIELRQAGLDAPILVMGYHIPDEAKLFVEYNLTTTVNTAVFAHTLSSIAQNQQKTAIIHVKVDTGMGRYGLLPNEVVPFFNEISQLPNLDIEGLYTHFSVADKTDKGYTRQQLAIFQDVLAQVEAAGHNIQLRHAANSAATLELPETHLDAVRVGIAMYGLEPNNVVNPGSALRPALTLKSHIARLRVLPKGSSVSYGRTYTTTRPTPVALIPVGYGDGYHRLHSSRGCVLIRGQRAPIVGRVCMDQFVVDVTDITDVRQDDEVVLIGMQGGQTIHAEEVAGWAKTINYEVTTSLLPRISRRYTPF